MKANKSEIAKMILSVLAVAGIIVVALTIPNIMMAFKPFMKGSSRKFDNKQIKHSLRGLAKNELIYIKQEGDQIIIKLTKNGRAKLLKYKLDDMKLKVPSKWDGKWRLVIFDIPEKFKTTRHYFRLKLKELGFVSLQKSVWVCPYPCEDEIDFIKEVYEIRPFVRVVTAESIDIQNDLKSKFNFA